jgi:arginase
MPTTRRIFLAAACSVPFVSRAAPRRSLDLILFPNNLGLRPPKPGVEPGTWRAPEVLDGAGLSAKLRPAHLARLPRRPYSSDPDPGSRVRNGSALHAYLVELSGEVERSLGRGALPVVIGGDCSTLLGGMLGLRHRGGRGLVHIDGHSDFFHPGNHDYSKGPGAAAGMDLAFATGRGEEVLTRWPGVTGPLVEDADVVQVGERYDVDDPTIYPDMSKTAIERIPVQALHAAGVAPTAERVLRRLGDRKIDRAWMHIDLDVLDESVMRAVDSPGSPGLTYAELADLGRALLRSGRIAGMNVSIYDPDLDPDGTTARAIVACLGSMLG